MAAVLVSRVCGRVSGVQLLAASSLKCPVSQVILPAVSNLERGVKGYDHKGVIKPFHISAVKETSNAHAHNHTKIWAGERVLATSLFGIVPASFMFPSPVMDYALAFALTTHVHWGMESIVVDYIRPSLFGSTIPKIAVAGVYGMTMLTLGGLFYFNYSDVGLVQAIKMFWKL
ncbi:succinate dehydrogenase, subunit D [Tachypleus tridentatus]|uniref:succinate dehydrogenase, subunit D n=1 Tax=Tachypleus tridentatus TaxID=6853 RepID=UPI003FD41B97